MIRRVGPLALLVCGLLSGAVGAPSSLASFTDATLREATIHAEVLDPPTSLAAIGGSSAQLTWTPTVDAWASGYDVLRSSTAGSGHVLVANVTPGAASSAIDSPGPGTWYYVLRSAFQGWRSVSSNEAIASIAAAVTTALASCASSAADTIGAGDNNGYEGNPARACVNNTQYATDSNTGSGSGGAASASCGTGAVPSATEDRHRFWGFAHGVPASAAEIEGIEVRADLGLNSASGTNNLCVQLSWDGGTTWTTIESQAVSAAGRVTYTFGGATNTWGRVWTPGELATTALRVRVINASSTTNRQFRLFWLAVRVSYVP